MYAAGTATKNISGFDPRSLPGCALWIDAADSSSLTLSGSFVTAIRDKSPFSNTIANASGTYSATSMGGYPGITRPLFTGTFTYGLSSFLHTSFCVAYSYGPGNGAAPYPFYEFNAVANGTSNHHLSILEYNNSGNYFRQARYVGIAVRTNTVTAVTLTPFIWTARDFATTAIPTSYQCGTVSGTPAGSGANTTSNALYFNVGTSGWQGGNVNSWGNGIFSEILTYNRILTSSEIQAVEGYLAWKWGIKGNIPTGHPYKTNLPALRTFTPNDLLIMPTMWFDAANTGTITSNASNVTTWSNGGTNGYNVSSNDAGSNTAFTGVATQNNLNVLQFSNYSFMSMPDTIFTANERSCFFSFKAQTNFSGTYMILMTTSNTIGGGMELGIDYFGANPVFFMQRNGTGPFVSFSTITTPVNNFWQCSFVNSATTTTSNAGSVNGSNLPLMSNVLANYTLNEPYQISVWNILRNWQLGDMIVYNRAVSQTERQQIEGYLGWKWGTTSLMPSIHPYKYVMPMSVAFNPRSLSNCLFWFDAADTSSIASNTSNITTWSNKGIAQVNALSNVSFTTGSTGINTINGLNVVNFAAGASMSLDNISTPNQARSAFVVTRNLTQLDSGIYQGFFNAGSAPGAGWQDFYMSSDGTNYYIGIAKNGDYGLGACIFSTTENPLNVVNMYGCVNSATAGSNAGTLNGSTMTLNFDVAATGYLTTTVPFTILATAGYNTAQDMAEFIQFDYALTPSDRYRVEGYLAWKWGIASSLPENHPFKKRQP